MPNTATLTLLGGWQMTLVAQKPVEPDYEKGRALLAYLALERQPHAREKLSELLWPGAPSGRANLRQILSNLRQVMGDHGSEPYLLVKRDSLRINPQAHLQIDAVAFAAAQPASGLCTDPASLAQLAQQVALYRGEFMAGFALPDCPDFEEWLQLQREALQRRALALLEQLANSYEHLGDCHAALPFALRYAALSPWDELACQRVMRLYASDGQYSAALAQFETCCRMLKTDLGVLPSNATRQLAVRVRQGQWRQRSPKRMPAAAPEMNLLPTERRQVTVLYCELSLAAVDDPDEAMALLSAPQSRCIDLIGQFAGLIVKTHAGGLLTYFGYPQAREDAPRRAVQAALALTRDLPADLDLRIGIHTGLILTGADPALPDPVGKTSRLATQVRLAAERRGIAISAATRHLVGGYFDCTRREPLALPGAEPPIDVFWVQGETGAVTRLEAAAQLSPLAGRLAEMAQLMALWQLATQGQAQAVLIQGEAGMGKSRLLHTLKHRLIGSAHAVRELRCFPEFSQSPFQPIRLLLEAAFGFQHSDTPPQKFAKLLRHLAGYHAATRQQDIALLAHWMMLPLDAAFVSPDLSPPEANQRIRDMLFGLLRALAASQPTLLMVEDLHWIDPSTLAWLDEWLQQPTAVLTVMTARPEFVPPWKAPHHATLALGGLDDDHLAAIVNASNHELDLATVQQIVQRADGVPLFAEEMAKMATRHDPTHIPSTLQDLLLARIDTLGDTKIIAQQAATLGREFDLVLLGKIASGNAQALARGLRRLQDAGLIVALNDSRSQFKHALIQEAAYQSMARTVRQAIHLRVAQTLLSDFADATHNHPELLAQHFSCAAETSQSIFWWIKAGQRAALNSANTEAIGHFHAGLQLLPLLPADPARAHTERQLLLGLCPVLYAAHGYGCDEARQHSARIAELNALDAQTHDARKQFQAQWARMVSTIATSGSRGMPQAARDLLLLANGDPLKQMAAHSLAGLASFWLGDFVAARQHDEQAMVLYQPHQSHLLVQHFGSDLWVNCASYLSCSLFFLGHTKQAQQVCQQTLQQARAMAHPHTLAQALSFAALLQRWQQLPEAALALSAQAIVIARQYDFRLWLACGEMTHGWARVQLGQADDLAEIDTSIAAMRSALGGISVVFLSARIEALMHLKQFATAQAQIAQTLAEAEHTGDGHFLAELHRLQGICLLQTALPGTATDAQVGLCFEQALTISRQQLAKTLEQRAIASLAQRHRVHAQSA